MDLEERGRPELAYAFVNAYLELGGDYLGLPILNFYFSYRLMVRAKVEAIRAYQQPRDSDSRLDAEKSFRTYLQLGVRHTHPRNPRLIITCGLSGSGKSSLTQSLLGPLQAIRIRSDVERKRLFGLSAGDDGKLNTRFNIYRPEATKRTYEKLLEPPIQDWIAAVLLLSMRPASKPSTGLRSKPWRPRSKSPTRS